MLTPQWRDLYAFKFPVDDISNGVGPSIYDVHMEEEGGQAQMDACGRGSEWRVNSMWTSTQNIKLEPIDVRELVWFKAVLCLKVKCKHRGVL